MRWFFVARRRQKEKHVNVMCVWKSKYKIYVIDQTRFWVSKSVKRRHICRFVPPVPPLPMWPFFIGSSYSCLVTTVASPTLSLFFFFFFFLFNLFLQSPKPSSSHHSKACISFHINSWNIHRNFVCEIISFPLHLIQLNAQY